MSAEDRRGGRGRVAHLEETVNVQVGGVGVERAAEMVERVLERLILRVEIQQP